MHQKEQLRAEQVDLIEAHGTSTVVGDKVEVHHPLGTVKAEVTTLSFVED